MPFKFNAITGRLDLVQDAITSPLPVSEGGTGRATLTDGAFLVGDGTNPVELIGPLTDGQLLIGDTGGVSPVAGSLTAPAAGVTITGGAGSITFALADDLAAVEGLATTGITARTAANTWTTRTITGPAAGISIADGDGVAGNPTLSLADDLAALEALATTGLAARTAASTWTTRSVAVTASTGLSVSNGDGVAGDPTLSGIDATSSVKGVATFDENDFLVTAGDVALAERTRLKSPYVENLGIDYNGGTGVFSIQGAQAALSSTNPGYVGIPSKADPGEINVFEITADQNFIDDVGASEIIGNLFGLTTSIAYAQDLPFYIYAVVNDDEDAVAFMISRIPHRTSAPAVGVIGAPDDAVADTQGSFWSLENIDETLYDTNPCVCIGSFRMQMSASDDWTVQTLDNADGIGQFQEGRNFTFSTGQFGSSTGTFMLPNGGTAPVFTTNNYQWTIDRTGFINIIYQLDGDGGTDGAGVVTLLMTVPLFGFFGGTGQQIVGNGFVVHTAGTVLLGTYAFFITGTASALRISSAGSTLATLFNSDFSNGSRTLAGVANYYASIL